MKRKTILTGLAALVVVAAAFALVKLYERSKLASIVDDEAAWDVLDSLSAATRMKVVILPDGTAARYVSENEDSYVADIQDRFSVPKSDARVELWTAADGRGVVYMKKPGIVQLLSSPNPTSAVKCNLEYEEGMCPCTYRCLGLKDGWYELDMGEFGSGFIQACHMDWDAIDTF